MLAITARDGKYAACSNSRTNLIYDFSNGLTMSKGTAIVTGGAGTLGLAISKGLRNDGWNVIILDRQEALEGFAPPEGIRTDALDVTDFEAAVPISPG
jgi:hypothetical protein